MEKVQTTLKDRIVAYLSKRKTPATYGEIAKALGVPTSSVRGRISEINATTNTHIAPTGEKRKCRATGSIVGTYSIG